jgi:hypothetical protein
MAFIYTEEGEYGGGELHLFDGKKKIKKIAEEVYDVKISDNGKAIAYLSEPEMDEDTYMTTYTLNLYKGGKSKVIESGVSTEFCISPNGKTVGYTIAEYEEQDEDDEDYYSGSGDYSYESFVWKGKSKSVGKDTQIIAVSDNYKYIYYVKNDNYYAQKKLNTDKKIKLGDSVESLRFNSDMSQCFYSEEGKAKIVSKAKEINSLKDSGSLMTPSDITVKRESTDKYSRYGIANFKDTFYTTYDTVYHIDNKLQATKVIKCDGAYLGKNAKTVFYIKDPGQNGEIYKINGKKENAEPTLLVSDEYEPSSFVVTDNGKGIYYANDDDEIYYQRGTGKSKQVGELEEGDYLDKTNLYKGKYLYWVEDAEVKRVKGSGNSKTVGNFYGDVTGVYCALDYINVSSTDDGEDYEYLSTNGKKFELQSTTEN